MAVQNLDRGTFLGSRPSPRLAGWLSAVAPGLGQLYLGRLPEAVLYLVLIGGAAIFTRFPLAQLLGSALIILPGHALRLFRSDGMGREGYKLEFLAVIGAFFTALISVGLAANVIDRLFLSGVSRREVNTYTHIFIGAVYFILKLVFSVLLERRLARGARR